MIIYLNSRFFGKNTIGITLYPFILLNSKVKNKPQDYVVKLINHEKIHIEQQKELLVLFFYIWYLVEFLIKSLIYGNKAYESLSFEREAYSNETNIKYIKSRKKWSFIKFI